MDISASFLVKNEIKTVQINLISMPESHTAAFLKETILNAFSEYSINIIVVTWLATDLVDLDDLVDLVKMTDLVPT